MARAYSLDLRERVVAAVAASMPDWAAYAPYLVRPESNRCHAATQHIAMGRFC
jgi:hypothetical protein